MKQKIRIGILFGGRSAEHEISLQSAKNVVSALNPEKYEIVLLGIDKHGKWYVNDYLPKELESQNFIGINCNAAQQTCLIAEGASSRLIRTNQISPPINVDVIFPVLHGTYGEDGTIQGLLKLAGLPFVGSDVLGSAVCMDKDILKRLLLQSGLPTAKFEMIRSSQLTDLNIDELIHKINLPCFVKPANLGSSIGISKVKTKEELMPALNLASRYDHKMIVEEYIPCREIECAVLGNEDPIASICAEIIPTHEFYTYEAKYLDENGANFSIPANIPTTLTNEIQQLAIKAFKALNCSGMARVDFFVTKDNKIYINELNTIPGFTRISMYPRLFAESGIPYEELIDRLIALALEKFDQDQSLITDYHGA